MAFGDTIQTVEASAGSGVATATFSAATSGNLLVFAVARSGVQTSDWDDPSGWTRLNFIPINSGNLAGIAWYKIAAGGETSVTTSGTGEAGNWGVVVSEFEGPFAASPLDQTAEDESNIATVVTSQASGTTGTTAQNDELAVACFAADNKTLVADGRSYSNSFTEVNISSTTLNRAAAIMAKLVLTATGTYSTTFTTTDTGDEMYGLIATFKKSAGGGSPQTVNLSTVTLASSVPAGDAQPGAVSITLDTLTLAGSVPQASITVGGVTITLDTLSLASSAIILTVGAGGGGGQTVNLSTLTLVSNVPSGSVIVGGVTINLDTITLAGSVVALDVVQGGVTITLDTLSLASSVIAFTVVPGAISVTLSVLTLASSAVSISAGSVEASTFVLELILAGRTPELVLDTRTPQIKLIGRTPELVLPER